MLRLTRHPPGGGHALSLLCLVLLAVVLWCCRHCVGAPSPALSKRKQKRIERLRQREESDDGERGPAQRRAARILHSGKPAPRKADAFVKGVRKAMPMLESELARLAPYGSPDADAFGKAKSDDVKRDFHPGGGAEEPRTSPEDSLGSAARNPNTPLPRASGVQCVADLYPRKFELHGHVVVMRLNPGVPRAMFTSALARAFAESFLPIVVDVVLLDESGISGELRRPELEVLFQAPEPEIVYHRLVAPRRLRQRWTAANASTTEETTPDPFPASHATSVVPHETPPPTSTPDPTLFSEARAGESTSAASTHSGRKVSSGQWRCVATAGVLEELIQQYVTSSPTFTTHIENGIFYGLDVRKVMFSSGNTTERMHFATVRAEDETVVDMFCGIGYFTLPLAVHGHPRAIHALDKNADSVAFVRLNAVMNGVMHVIHPQCGDNREVGNELIGSCDRVLMGYLPSCKTHLSRAIMFLRHDPVTQKPTGIIHYHYLADLKEAREVLWRDFKEELGEEVVNEQCVRLVELRRVKSYAPKLFHFVADVRFSS